MHLGNKAISRNHTRPHLAISEDEEVKNGDVGLSSSLQSLPDISLTQWDDTQDKRDVFVGIRRDKVYIFWGGFEVTARVATTTMARAGPAGDCSRPELTRLQLSNVTFRRSRSFALIRRRNHGENRHVTVACRELSYSLNFNLSVVILWIRTCPALGSVGFRLSDVVPGGGVAVGGVSSASPGGRCAPPTVRVSARIRSVDGLDQAGSALWAAPAQHGEYSRCSLAASRLACFGAGDVLTGPLLVDLRPLNRTAPRRVERRGGARYGQGT